MSEDPAAARTGSPARSWCGRAERHRPHIGCNGFGHDAGPGSCARPGRHPAHLGCDGRPDRIFDEAIECCDLHGRNCEAPSELCCSGCTEVAHDTLPIRHADGSSCVLDGQPDAR